MEDASFVNILEQYLKSVNLNGNYKLLPDNRNEEVRCIRYQLSVDDRTVIGFGKTKKKAKEDAAEIMYNMLIDEERKRAFHSIKEKIQDPIEELIDLCSRHNLGSPQFEYESDIVSIRRTMHTVSCSVLGLSEEVKSFRKEHAKKQAASVLLSKLKEQEKVHDIYLDFKEKEVRNNVRFRFSDGSVDEEAEGQLIAKVRRQQFSDYLKRSKTALDMKMKHKSFIDEVKDPEALFIRILKEMDVEYEVSFVNNEKEWVCSIEIFPLYFKMSNKNQDKSLAGKFAIKKVLKHMRSL